MNTCTLILSLCLALVAQERKPITPHALDAAEILERMSKVYGECTSYRDSGEMKTVFFDDDGGERTSWRSFTTAFVRSGNFRFEFRENSNNHRYLIARSGKTVRTWWDARPGVESERSLERAIAAATGVSGGTAQYVPGYLVPSEVNPWRLPYLDDLQRIEDADIAGRAHYRITGTFDASANVEHLTLWIDKQTSLLRRIEERTQFDDFRTEETIDYEPEVNVAIPAALLAFDPPGAVTER